MSVMNERPVPSSQLRLLWRDVWASLAHWRFWIHLGLEDILKQYRRSYLGPVWISLNTAVFIVAFSVIGSQVFKIDLKEYLVYFCVGHIMFLFISSLVSEGCQTFVAADAFLKQTPYPKVAFVLRVVWRNLINMAHNLPVMLLVLMLYGDLWAIRIDVFAFDVVLTVFSAILLVSCMGAICARFRDVPMIVTSVMQISMFVTPVMWKPSQLSERAQLVVYLNPLAAYLELLRAPLVGRVPDFHHYLTVLVVMGVLLLGFFTIFLNSRRRLVYWL